MHAYETGKMTKNVATNKIRMMGSYATRPKEIDENDRLLRAAGGASYNNNRTARRIIKMAPVT